MIYFSGLGAFFKVQNPIASKHLLEFIVTNFTSENSTSGTQDVKFLIQNYIYSSIWNVGTVVYETTTISINLLPISSGGQAAAVVAAGGVVVVAKVRAWGAAGGEGARGARAVTVHAGAHLVAGSAVLHKRSRHCGLGTHGGLAAAGRLILGPGNRNNLNCLNAWHDMITSNYLKECNEEMWTCFVIEKFVNLVSQNKFIIKWNLILISGSVRETKHCFFIESLSG